MRHAEQVAHVKVIEVDPSDSKTSAHGGGLNERKRAPDEREVSWLDCELCLCGFPFGVLRKI
jgi:hypothetical protein